MISFEITEIFQTSAKDLFQAWLNSKAHSAMTGGEAVCNEVVNGNFTAWDGYISGKNKSINPHKKIVQNWRTVEFKEGDSDSTITITFKEIAQGCEMTLVHENIPLGQPDYKQGWHDHYLKPMQEYFESLK